VEKGYRSQDPRTSRRFGWSPYVGAFVGQNLLIAASTVTAGALGFFLQALLSHHLEPADFGATFTVLSILALICLPASSLALVVARETSRGEAHRRSNQSEAIVWRWHRYALLGGFALAAVSIPSANWVARFFQVPTAVIAPAALSIPFGLAIPLLLGQLQGRQDFSKLSILLVGQAAVRLIAAVSLAALLGVVGAFLGVALGNIVIYVLAFAMIHRTGYRRLASPNELGSAYRSLAVILPSSLALAVLFSTDVLLVKHFFNTVDAGRYAAVAALGRAIFWGAGGIALVLFPKAVVHERRGSNGSHLVLASIGMCLLGGAVALAIFSVSSGFVLSAFAGPAYASAGSYLPGYAIAMTLLGGASVLVAIGQARGKADFLVVLFLVMILEPALIIKFHQTLSQVVQVLTGSMAALFIGLAILYLIREHARAQSVNILGNAAA
jgi:O-antigen/teichoic acid export membrane protein